MKHYRLKPEAVQFFKPKYATTVHSYDTWESIGVDVKALEEVEEAYLTFGHKSTCDNISSGSLSGWSAKEGSHYNFTIHFPSEKMRDHDNFSKGKVLRELMNKIQKEINYFYIEFSSNDQE